jgi:hypothetical protein
MMEVGMDAEMLDWLGGAGSFAQSATRLLAT